MSATVARQGGQIQLEQSDMQLVLKMVKTAKGGYSQAAMEKMLFHIPKHHAVVQPEARWGVELPEHRKVKTVIEIQPSMFHETQTPGYLPCKNCRAKHLQSRWRCHGTFEPPLDPHRQPIPEPKPHPPRIPPAVPSNDKGAVSSQIEGVPPGYMYIHTPPSKTHFLYLDAYSKNRKLNNDVIPDLMTDDVASTGEYAICCMAMQLTSILRTSASN